MKRVNPRPSPDGGVRESRFLPSSAREKQHRTDFRGISSAGRAPGLQPGGHRFEPGILQPSPPELTRERAPAGKPTDVISVDRACKRRRRPVVLRVHASETERGEGAPRVKRARGSGGAVPRAPKLRGIVPPDRSLTIEYPANGSFFRPQHMQCVKELSRAASSFQLAASSKRVRDSFCWEPKAGSWELRVSASSSRTMVKLLRAYGECLGARSR